ncbi:hypothetical protein SIPHO059v1_p0043 [Vibrio phage 264E42.1]|nr:hypothetical protein SIPHO059v1_p0043 [Vibrio phage 264E42.1]
MAEPAKIDLTTVKRGDTYIVDFYFTDTDGTKDISAVTIDAQARREMDGALWFDLKPVKVDASNGHFRIHLTHDETRSITESPPGSFSGIFDIQFSWQGANEVYVSTIVAGSISISKDVTQPVSLQTSGSSPMVPPSSQEVNVYLSLNPGSPNYSDVVTAEQLTPVQYDLSASLGLANVNAINEAAESAKIAKAAAAEAVAAKNEARQSATLATMQATKATNEADRAKTEADKAKQVSGLDTVDQAVDMAMAEFAGMMSETDRNAILRMNEAKYDASGFVDMGKSFNAAAYSSVNEGLFVRNDNPNYANQVYIGASASNALGTSKTNHAVTHIAGAVANVLNIDNEDKSWVDAAWNLKPAPDGTDIYDSTGDCRGSGKASLNLKTDIDPKYGNVPAGSEAQILREAVGRAFEGLVKNGDFRNGNANWTSDRGGVVTVVSGVATISGNTGWTTARMLDTAEKIKSGKRYVISGLYHEGGEDLNLALSGTGSVLLSKGAQSSSDAPRYFEVEFEATADSTSTSYIYTTTASPVGISGISLREVTEVVVTHPVDGIFIESYDEELRGRVEIMENIQSTATTFGTTSVPTVLSTRKLSYFQQYDGQFPEVVINPDFINDRYRCVVWTDLTEPQKREIAAYMGEKLFMGVNGFPVNTRNRARTIRGAGNGDWSQVNSAENTTLRFKPNAFSYVKAKGVRDSLDSTADGVDGYYSKDRVDRWKPDWFSSKGSFVAGNNTPQGSTDIAYKGRCFFYVVATVPRANQGAYHPDLNPYGTKMHDSTRGVGFSQLWYEAGAIKLNTTKDAFTVANVTGAIGGLSGHPDGIFYDGIEAGGLNGVIGWRLGAVANDSPEEAAKVEAKVENGTYRGLEKLVKSRATIQNRTSYTGAFQNIDISKSLNAKVGDSIWVTNGSDWFIREISGIRTAEDATNDVQVFWIDVVAGGSRTKGDAAILVKETNLSVSGEFNTQMVIGDPVEILKTDALKDGWLGTWCPVIPDGVIDEFPMTRKCLSSSVGNVFTSDTGVSWSSGVFSGINLNTVTNAIDFAMGDNNVIITSYKAFAKQTKPSTIKPVLNATKGLLGITVTQNHDKAVLSEAVAGIILKSDASGIVTEQSQAVKYLVDGTIKRLKTLPTDMVAPTNSSQAIKIAVYQISNNGQTSLAIIANTMTHNGTSWGELDEIHIPSSGSDTFPDGNNIKQQAFCTELSIPTGWTSNRARVGTQVAGVDL